MGVKKIVVTSFHEQIKKNTISDFKQAFRCGKTSMASHHFQHHKLWYSDSCSGAALSIAETKNMCELKGEMWFPGYIPTSEVFNDLMWLVAITECT